MTAQNKPIELYFFPTPNGYKISAMLEELGVPYDLRIIHIGKGDQFTPEFLSVSPNNKIPAIVDPEGPDGVSISVFESGAILKYLATKFGKFYPTDQRSQVAVDEWLFWQVGGFGPMLGQNHHFALYAPEKIEYAINRYRDETHRLYGVLNKQLDGRDYIVGDFSIADLASIGWARGWERQGMDIKDFPNVAAWIERVSERPGTKAGLALTLESGERVDLTKDVNAKAVLFGQRAR
ncbi:glutathione S-transferase N-terminal domain-containing protein [Devosia rhodophyticola]|uniref:Glutathione S-transferase N-terminal domain-containing protein n=1 Tax=Devosia rhodophyticola TaxID=3026423 RepID=A0ABY7YW79_9HYPH|nr:glutathione S-transferase N-terminal domain-containing protein [Devosia rhodophyticola]WDR05616.1 glutathione S-transferase N-terminal domain-containing protein [Devosia rhodophyticola]